MRLGVVDERVVERHRRPLVKVLTLQTCARRCPALLSEVIGINEL